jgi:hypothetical protein
MIKRILFLAVVLISSKSYSQTDSTNTNGSKDTTILDSRFNIPIFSTSGGDLEGDMDQQDVSALLMSSRDVFTQFASFQFGAARYRMRGYMAENQTVMINGINVNNLETGFSSWSSWGGLNDVTRYIENRFGVVANRYGFSGPGGYTNIDSKASSFKKGTRVGYASANRIFQHRGMLTHSTGMMKNGWAITISGSTRQGDAQRGPKMFAQGTYFNASAYYVSIDKRINDKHMLSFTGFGAPIEQGRMAAHTLEAYNLVGSNYYNSVWGYQNGKVRNSSVSNVHRPMLMLSHIFNLKEDSKLTTSVYYNFGKSGRTRLNYGDGPSPRADYYRYMPSFYYLSGDTINGDILRDKWENNTDGIQQIRWDDLIAANQANLYTLPSQAGQINTTESRGIYVLENAVEDMKNVGFNTVFNKRIDKLFLSIGLNGNIYRTRKYKVVEDLLGATYWLDVDQFADQLGVDPKIMQNNIDKPDNKVKQGEEFGYNYNININRAELWAQGEYNLKAVDLYLGFTVSDVQTWREGHWANGKFPTNSKGKSKVVNFVNYGVKGGATYRISGRHFLTVNGTYFTRTPESANIFTAPRVRSDVVDGIQNEKVLSADANYIIRYPGLKVRLTYYYTQINDQTWVRSFYHDSYNNLVNLIMKDVDQNHQGIELGLEKTLFTSHVIQAAIGYGQFLYTNRPKLEAWQENNATALFTDRTVYLKNYRVGSSPQLVSGIGYKYNGKKFWFAGLYFNYFDEIYMEANPDRRTEEAVSGIFETDKEDIKRITGQERLPSYFTLNANAGKSFRLQKKYFLSFNFSVNNLLNNKTIRTSGYEQLRWDYTNVSKFDNKYYYMQGITYMAIVNFSF